jgi:hypothetical protein
MSLSTVLRSQPPPAPPVNRDLAAEQRAEVEARQAKLSQYEAEKQRVWAEERDRLGLEVANAQAAAGQVGGTVDLSTVEGAVASIRVMSLRSAGAQLVGDAEARLASHLHQSSPYR